jgi:enoyl-CoA hydratase/carnithine racemase
MRARPHVPSRSSRKRPRRSSCPRESVRQTRRLLRNAEALAARIAEENAIFAAQLRSAEAREAFAAFREKRPADFSRVR